MNIAKSNLATKDPVGLHSPKKANVLIVDDISTNIDVLMQALEPLGYSISAAPSGEVALQLAPKLKPDIILLDVMMANLDGFETCRLLKKDPQTKDIPVIFITARNDIQDLMAGFNVGAVDYISKPFNFEEVCARVSVHFQNQSLLREREQMLLEYKKLMDQLSIKSKELEKAHHEALEANEKLKHAQSQLVHGEKMAALGEMVSGIGHEVNNPCNFIINNVAGLNKNLEKIRSMLNQILSGDDSGERIKGLMSPYWQNSDESILSIREGADRIAGIVKSLRNFSRLGEGDLNDVDINEVAAGTIKIMSHLMNDLEFETEFLANATVKCSPAQISQVIMNVLGNAIYAANMNVDGGRVSVKTRNTESEVILEVQDNGPGIPENIQQKVFEPFFTTKPVGEGSGLGLSISYKIMQEHGGQIEFDTSSSGTTFRVILQRR